MSRFFNPDSPIMRKLTFLFDCMVLSFVFCIVCLPVFTTGAAFSALYPCACLGALGDEFGPRDFFRAFKRSFKKVTPIWLGIAMLGILLICNLLLIKLMPTEVHLFMQAGTLSILLWLTLGGVSLFPLLYLHPNASLQQLVPKAFLFSIQNLPRTGFITMILWAPVLLLFLSPAKFLYASMFFLFFWPCLTAHLHTRLLRQKLDSFEL